MSWEWKCNRRFIGSTSTGTCLASQSIGPSTKSQSIHYTTLEDGFIEFRVINEGLKGNFEYNFTVNELNSSSLDHSSYQCALNLTNGICQHTTVYNSTYLLALVTLDNENSQAYPTFNGDLWRWKQARSISHDNFSLYWCSISVHHFNGYDFCVGCINIACA